MSDPKQHRTRSGRTLTDEDIDAIAREVEETDYDIEALKTRRLGTGFNRCAQRLKPVPRPITPLRVRSSEKPCVASSMWPDAAVASAYQLIPGDSAHIRSNLPFVGSATV